MSVHRPRHAHHAAPHSAKHHPPAAKPKHHAAPRRAGHSGASSFQGSASAPGVDLARGATGPNVKALQDALVKLNYLSHAAASSGPGIFGPNTEAALKHFQADHGVPSTGFYGPMTRAALNRALGGSGQAGGSGTATGSGGSSAAGSARVHNLLARFPVGSYAGQCSGFTATAMGVPGFPRADGLGPANGDGMVNFLVGTGRFHRVSSPQPGDAFSHSGGRYGHTGIVVSVHGGMVDVIDSNWNLDQRIHVHTLPLSYFSGFARSN
jgi:peptidoglycan hydrolase-like protein with peptidoglycan-binding domain